MGRIGPKKFDYAAGFISNFCENSCYTQEIIKFPIRFTKSLALTKTLPILRAMRWHFTVTTITKPSHTNKLSSVFVFTATLWHAMANHLISIRCTDWGNCHKDLRDFPAFTEAGARFIIYYDYNSSAYTKLFKISAL